MNWPNGVDGANGGLGDFMAGLSAWTRSDAAFYEAIFQQTLTALVKTHMANGPLYVAERASEVAREATRLRRAFLDEDAKKIVKGAP